VASAFTTVAASSTSWVRLGDTSSMISEMIDQYDECDAVDQFSRRSGLMR
jgi:hypothetical protein